MRKLLFIPLAFLLLLMCGQQEQITPMDCYYVKLTTSTLDGHIISTESNHSFTFDASYLEKWNSESVRVTRDTVLHRATIEMWQCVLPDRKDLKKYFTQRK